jgi:hypothetical protein
MLRISPQIKSLIDDPITVIIDLIAYVCTLCDVWIDLT